jgi:hypothetical protein
MYQGYHSSVASQRLCRYVILTLSGIDELIQITTGSELGMDGSRLWGFEGRCRSIDVVIAAVIFDASILSLLSSLTMVIQICNFDSARD